jgi:hypothetical protein
MKKNTNRYEIKIITKKGEEILVDYEDFEKVKRYSWCISKTGYPVANIGYKVIKLHRYILNIDDPKVIIDHKNRNRLDNRRKNLRICNVQENARNTTVSKSNQTGYLGISKTAQGKYRARIMVNRKEIRLGHYDNLEDAIRARKEAEKLYFKDFAPSVS